MSSYSSKVKIFTAFLDTRYNDKKFEILKNPIFISLHRRFQYK